MLIAVCKEHYLQLVETKLVMDVEPSPLASGAMMV